MGQVAWRQVILAGWPVLSVLFIGSIVTFAVIWERWKVYSRIKVNQESFLNSLKNVNDVQKVIAWCEKSDQPLAFITKAIFKSDFSQQGMEKALQRSVQSLVKDLEVHIPVLGTIASVAPFVGLLGTVIGIIRSFQAVSAATSGGASMVAVGISEALVGTAGGLIVAIPALLGYNYFVNKLRRLTQEWELVGADIMDMATKHRTGRS